jgi:hypothetical protein
MLRVTWAGYPGNEYEFEVYPLGTAFKPFSGVYVACASKDGIKWNAFYIGEAKSFSDRLNAGFEHNEGLKCARRRGATHLGAMIVNGDANRLAIETELRHVLNPPCNKQDNALLNALSDYMASKR